MIATGLCLMGGCFAQDDASQVVETYWPAHAVRVDHETIVLKPYGDDLLLPFWTMGVRAGGRLENVSSNESDKGGANILNWGEWGPNFTSYEVNDAFYLATNFENRIFGALVYAVCASSQSRTWAGVESAERFINYMEAYAADNKMCVNSSLGSGEADVAGWPSSFDTPWQIRIKGQSNTCDVVSFWWYNDLQRGYFMVQPMRSVHGDPAFFTHGYDILTEL